MDERAFQPPLASEQHGAAAEETWGKGETQTELEGVRALRTLIPCAIGRRLQPRFEGRGLHHGGLAECAAHALSNFGAAADADSLVACLFPLPMLDGGRIRYKLRDGRGVGTCKSDLQKILSIRMNLLAMYAGVTT